MATTQEFVDYVCAQIAGAGHIREIKMMGERCVYVNERPVILVCNNAVYLNKVKGLEDLLADAELGVPYNGAKERYILDIDNSELATEAARIAAQNSPLPKPKKKGGSK